MRHRCVTMRGDHGQLTNIKPMTRKHVRTGLEYNVKHETFMEGKCSECGSNKRGLASGNEKAETQEIRKDERSKLVGWVREILITLIH